MEERPAIHDVIKIDGRLAQVLSNDADQTTIKYLDDASSSDINWSEYRMVKSFFSYPLKLAGELIGLRLTKEEIKNIVWSSDKKNDLKKQVRAFGEYEKI